MKKVIVKEKVKNNKIYLNSLLKQNKKNNLFEKDTNLKNRIFSANLNKMNMKFFYFTQNKPRNNNPSPGSKNSLSAIKRISYKKLFNLNNEEKSTENLKKNYPELSLLNKDIVNLNIFYNLYNSINNSPRKYIKKYHIKKESKLSPSFKNNRNKSVENFYKKINPRNKNMNNYNKKLTKSNSEINYNIFNNYKILLKNNQEINNKSNAKKYIYLKNLDKINTVSNACDASTNTQGLFNNNKINNSKVYKRPLMIDYFYSEHTKFCYGFDKLKGKNKYKKPYFIVHKY